MYFWDVTFYESYWDFQEEAMLYAWLDVLRVMELDWKNVGLIDLPMLGPIGICLIRIISITHQMRTITSYILTIYDFVSSYTTQVLGLWRSLSTYLFETVSMKKIKGLGVCSHYRTCEQKHFHFNSNT